MEYKLIHQTAILNNIIYDGNAEQAIDCDLTLPDYCPAIQRILKCNVQPQITNYQLVGDRLNVDGNALVKIYYTDENNKCVRCYEYPMPFSKSVEINNIEETANVKVKAELQYVNCRAVSQRRVDIHGSFILKIKITNCKKENIVCGVEGQEVEFKKKNISICNITSQIQRQFSMNEVLEIGSSKPAIDKMIRCSVTPVLRDYKIITNKILLKGELLIKALYSSECDECKLELFENSIPINQIIEIDEIEDSSVCDIHVSTMNFELQPKNSSSGEQRLIDTNVKIDVGIKSLKTIDIDFITDAYCTKCKTSYEKQNIKLDKLIESFRDSFLCRKTVNIGKVETVLDIWCEDISFKTSAENGSIVLTGTAVLNLLAISEENAPVYIERTVDFEYKREISTTESEIKYSPNVMVTNLDYNINSSESLDVRLEFGVDASVFVSTNTEIISSITLNENDEKESSNTAVTIYFAEAGEEIWTIARNYNTTVSSIMQENELKDEVLREKCMLLIPCV